MILCAALLSSLLAAAQPLPGGRPEDAQLAKSDPDEFAWRLFLALERPANPNARGEPDPEHGALADTEPDRAVVWESWAQATGGRMPEKPHLQSEPSEVFPDRGAPKPWSELAPMAGQVKSLEPILFEGIIDPEMHDHNAHGERSGNEVRFNRAAYEYLRANQLYDFDHLKELAKTGKVPEFPAGAQVVKAVWVKIREEDKPRFHWRSVKTFKGETELWGLTGFHLISKDLPHWFWCDFEHEDFEKKAEAPSRDSTTRGAAAKHGHDGIRAETEGSVWSHYRLRGSQIDYADAQKRPVVLANTLLEHTFQSSSSCMSCHVRAANDPKDMHVGQPSALKPFLTLYPSAEGPVGPPTPRWFKDAKGRGGSTSTDFLWGLVLRANKTGAR